MKNVGITIIPRDTLTAKNPGIYLSIDRGDKDQNRIPKFEFKMP
jgi:hypothetical protein